MTSAPMLKMMLVLAQRRAKIHEHLAQRMAFPIPEAEGIVTSLQIICDEPESRLLDLG